VQPFVKAILASIILAYMTYPLYKFLNKKIKSKNLCSLIITVIVTLILIVPPFFALKIISTETYSLYLFSKQKVASGDLFNFNCQSGNVICETINSFQVWLAEPKVQFQLQEIAANSTTWIKDFIEGIIISLPTRILIFFVMIYSMFFFLRDGISLTAKVTRLIPLKKTYQKKILQKSKDVTFAVVYGHLFVALIQGTLGGIGFFLFGVNSPILWGIVMAFAALIPFVGTPIIWLPAALFKIFNGLALGDNHIIWQGIFLILYGTLIVSTIDNLLKPKIIGDKAKVHPLLVLLGVLGGLKMLGIIGLVIGPVIQRDVHRNRWRPNSSP
jgi:predicted PurR-regulated permease PerM